mgnify:FL=1
MEGREKTKWKVWVLCWAFLLAAAPAWSAEKDELKAEVAARLQRFAEQYARVRTIKVVSLTETKRHVRIEANEALEDLPFRPDRVEALYDTLRPLFAEGSRLRLTTRGTPIEELVPEYAKTKGFNKCRHFAPKTKQQPLITPLDRPYTLTKGLQDRYIALWSSHGYYYAQKAKRWKWQRARLFGTVEDLFTHSFVVPYLMPMLELAGAQVFLPRERDVQTEELIVDQSGATAEARYQEEQGDRPWEDGGSAGYGYRDTPLLNGENPFTEGGFRQTSTIKQGRESVARWLPHVRRPGRYAVYVAYRSLQNSTEQAHYTIYHAGETTRLVVNQTMGGGTWIYLGHYYFRGTDDEAVCLSNRSEKAGKRITADAVRFGGGYGSVARSPEGEELQPETSGLPRFAEAARYWLQGAGMPDTVYSSTAFADDYRDDIFARPRWVNWLRDEAHIPIELSFALHSDAGITPDDSIIGTLGIYYSKHDGGRYRTGESRKVARDLTERIQSQIVADIQALRNPDWSRRGMWNQSYIEARVAEVPTMLLELLSHQNFADMRLGLDPKFRFLVSRAIYKGMLRHIAAQHRQEAIVQPLPPQAFSATFASATSVRLAWQPQPDPLEPTAEAKAYVVYTAQGEGDFDNGRIVNGQSVVLPIQPGVIYRYKVVAWNEGGISFPSEELSVYRAEGAKATRPVLIVNAFDRVDGPLDMEQTADSLAGFCYAEDGGVPYLYDFAFIGEQHDFKRSSEWISNDRNGHGDCYTDFAGQVTAGNQFHYPFVHGKALAEAGYSYASCSAQAFLHAHIERDAYAMLDLIWGKQRLAEADSSLWQQAAAWSQQGVALLVSGSRWLSDAERVPALYRLVRPLLSVQLATPKASRTGAISGWPDRATSRRSDYSIGMQRNADCYAVEAVDGLLPFGEQANAFLRYTESRVVAGVTAPRTCALGFPIETLRTEAEREELMRTILRAILP